MTRKSLCSRLKSGLEQSCWTGSPPVCERLRATKADLFRAGLQVQRASGVNRRAKRLGQINKNPVRNIDHVRSYFRKQAGRSGSARQMPFTNQMGARSESAIATKSRSV